MKRNIYTNFQPINWNKSYIFRKNFFNDFEFVLISNYLTKQEDQVLFITNLEIKMNSRNSKLKSFRIPYKIIEEKTGLDKNKIQKILKSLKDKKILNMEKPNHWAWDLPGIKEKLSPGSQVAFSASKYPKLISFESYSENSLSDEHDLYEKFWK